MKKTYQQPITLTVHLKPSMFVCGSGKNAKGNAHINITGANDQGVVIRSRQHGIWDDEDD